MKELVVDKDLRVDGQDFKAGDTIATVETAVGLSTLAHNILKGDVVMKPVAQAEPEKSEQPAPRGRKSKAETKAMTSETSTTPGSETTANAEPDAPPAEDQLKALIDAGIPKNIAKVLEENAVALKEPRLLTPDGIREWVKGGGDLDALENFGPTRIKSVKDALKIE